MARLDDEYKLGKDVTEKFRGVKPKESVVLSVRMSTRRNEIRLEALCKETGKTVAQVVRESVANYQPANPQREAVLTIVNSVGGEFRSGPPQSTEVAGLLDTEEPVVSP